MTERSGPIRSILIVGGGTAGWLSAAYLNRALGSKVEITLVESSLVNPVGVGEATVPTLVDLFRFLGMDEEEWMPRCNATFKTAIRFDGWMAPTDGHTHSYYHPFPKRPDELVPLHDKPYFPKLGEGFSLIHYWLKRHLAGDPEPYAYACFEGARLCDLKKSPRFKDGPQYEIRSAYHFDAGLVASYLRDLAVGRGVRHIVQHVEGVDLDEQGFVQAVNTRDGRRLTADLFLDCSGFKGLILNQALDEEFLSDNDALFCDAAVAVSARNHPEDGLDPFTTATAQSSGWTWDIPLYHRRGCGYVYSTAFQDSASAEAECMDFFGEDSRGEEPRHIRIRCGRNRRSWVKNCVAIGLSSCFLEPLESTGIFLIEFQLGQLVTLFPDRSFSPALRTKYNQVLQACYEQTRDFIVMHYVLSDREDTPFWRAVRNETKIPDTLQESLEYFRDHLPILDGNLFTVFTDRSFTAVLAGMGAIPRRSYPILDLIGDDEAERRFAALRRRTAELEHNLPGHYEYLTNLHYRNARASGRVGAEAAPGRPAGLVGSS